MSRLSKALKKVVKPVAAIGLAVALPALATTAITAFAKARSTPTAEEQAAAVTTAGATVAPPAPKVPEPVRPLRPPGNFLESLGGGNTGLILLALLGFALVMAVKK